MWALSPYLNHHGECWVHATLHEITEQGPRSTKTLAEVRIDGHAVGRLSPKLSGDLLPAVVYLSERGHETVVRAIVKGNKLKAEVVVYAARSHELPADWFEIAGREHGTDQPEPGDVADSAADPAPPPPPPPAWYADPWGVARLRWWDGAKWTEHTTA